MPGALAILISDTGGVVVGPAEYVHHGCIGSSGAFVVRATADFGPLRSGRLYIFSYAGAEETDNAIAERLPVTYLYLEGGGARCKQPHGVRSSRRAP